MKVNVTGRKNIKWDKRLVPQGTKLWGKDWENKIVNADTYPNAKTNSSRVYPTKINQLLTEIETIEFNKQIKPNEIDLIVEFSNNNLSIVKATSVECDTSVLGKTVLTIHYHNLQVSNFVTVVKPKE